MLIIIPNGQIDCWIGLNDRDNEGTYVWADGSPFIYENYDTNQPDNATVTGGIVEGEDCFQTKFGGPRAWNDDYCNSTERCYICGRTSKFRIISKLMTIYRILVTLKKLMELHYRSIDRHFLSCH